MQVRPDLNEQSAQMFLESEKDWVEKVSKKFMYLVHFADFKKKSPLVSFLCEWKAGMYKFDTIDSELKAIRAVVEKKFLQNAAEELALLSARGIDEITNVAEQKWSRSTNFRIIGIVLIGLAQIALGIAVEVLNLVPGAEIAVAFIAEGIDDIMFALNAVILRHCSMKGYAKHKPISLAITICTSGLFALFARVAEVSRSGGTTLGKQLAKKACKEITKSSIAKQVTVRVAKQLLEAAVFRIETTSISTIIEKLLHEKLTEISRSIIDIFRDKKAKDQLKKIIGSICEML